MTKTEENEQLERMARTTAKAVKVALALLLDDPGAGQYARALVKEETIDSIIAEDDLDVLGISARTLSLVAGALVLDRVRVPKLIAALTQISKGEVSDEKPAGGGPSLKEACTEAFECLIKNEQMRAKAQLLGLTDQDADEVNRGVAVAVLLLGFLVQDQRAAEQLIQTIKESWKL